MKIAAKIGLRKNPAVLLCPVCGHRLTPNKGWAVQFYDGYCNRCDMAVEAGQPQLADQIGGRNGKESVQAEDQ